MTAPARTLAWVREGTDLLLGAVDRLADDDLDAPTALPGWTRRHLVAHVGCNARALSRLVAWARTGRPTPMYASPQQRAAEIEESAREEPARLRGSLVETARALDADLAALTDDAWRAEVVTAQGRTVPASEVPWMRVREVTVHAVDLGTGVSFTDLPAGVCAALVADAAAMRSRRADGPALELTSHEGQAWQVTGSGQPVRVHADVVVLAQWLTGRGQPPPDASGAPAPVLGPWI